MDKVCRFCGERLPEAASFCPHCARSQLDRQTVRMPQPRKRRRFPILPLIALAVMFLGIGMAMLGMMARPAEPQPDETEQTSEAAPEETTEDAAAETSLSAEEETSEATELVTNPPSPGSYQVSDTRSYNGFRDGRKTELRCGPGTKIQYFEYYNADNRSLWLFSDDGIHGRSISYQENKASNGVRYISDIRKELMEYGIDLSDYLSE